MATEEYKILTSELAKNYLELKAEMRAEGFTETAINFTDYLKFYREYEEAGLLYSNADHELEDEEEDLEEDEEYNN
jgi:hypothetical protein